MNKQASPNEQNLKVKRIQPHELAILGSNERICSNAQHASVRIQSGASARSGAR